MARGKWRGRASSSSTARADEPRRGSFEVTLLRADGSSAELWTGLKKGPPRRLKFPEPHVVLEELKKYLS
ncbi:hypothetical protein CapIbe_013437 [Capra ibex]